MSAQLNKVLWQYSGQRRAAQYEVTPGMHVAAYTHKLEWYQIASSATSCWARGSAPL